MQLYTYAEVIEATSDRERIAHYLSADSNETFLAVIFVHDNSIAYHQRNIS